MTAQSQKTQAQKVVMLVVMPMIMLVCYLVLLNALKGDNTLQKVLAGSGFAVFSALYAALLYTKLKGSRS